MSRFAQIGWGISKRLWEAFLYLLVTLYVALAFHLGLWGTLLAFIAIGLFSRFVLARIRRRRPGSALSEIGRIEMEFAAWTIPGQPIKFLFGAFILFLVLWMVLLGHEVLTVIESHFQGVRQDSDLSQIILQVSILTGWATSMYANYRNRWRRLLITDQGLFQVIDPERQWPSDRPLDEPDSPLRARRIYGWEQIARFHWSRQSGEHVLHLNVHQRGFGVPQLVSFMLHAISEEGWQKLDQLLRTHTSGTVPHEPGRALTTSGAMSGRHIA